MNHARYLDNIKSAKRLENRIEFSLKTYPCECLLIHRDAEGQPAEWRRSEIQKAVECLEAETIVAHVCVIPIRMTEAWLLFNEAAIRRASGNPNGKVSLDLPKIAELEDKPNPKQLLHEALTKASEYHGRRRKSFQPKLVIPLITQSIDDFSPLRTRSAFRDLEGDVERIIKENQWNLRDD